MGASERGQRTDELPKFREINEYSEPQILHDSKEVYI